MDNTPNPTNQPNGTGNETPEVPTTPTPETSPVTTPEAPQEPATLVATPTETTATAATVEPTIAEPTPVATESTVSEPVPAPVSSETQPIATPVTPTPVTNPITTPTPTISQTPVSAPPVSTNPKKPNLPIGLIIGLAVGGVVLLGGIVTAVVLLLAGGKVDYEATYKSFDAIEISMDDLDYGDCYKVHSRIDSSYTSSSEYSDYITGCVEELVALESATSEFGKSSGAKHDEDIKKAYNSFKTAFNSIYTKKSELESQLSVYNAYHEFHHTIGNASTSTTKNLESAIISAAAILEDTKNPTLTEFAKGFREKGLAYVRAIDDYRNSSNTSYSDVYDKMNDFTDYVENNTPEIDEITGLDFTKINDLSSAYDDLYTAVRDAYYDHMN